MYTAKNKVALMITANVFTIIPENTYNLRNYNLRNYNGFRLSFWKDSLPWHWKYLVSRTKNMRYCSYRIKECPIP